MPENASPPQVNFAVSELGRTIVTMRRDLIYRPNNFDGRSCYVIEDPLKGKFYRAGVGEYALLSLFDGKTSVADALSILASSMPDLALYEQDAASICSWLVSSNLAFTSASASSARLEASTSQVKRAEFWRRWNVVSLRLPLLKPDRLFNRLTPYVNWLYSWPGFALWALLLVAAVLQALIHRRTLVASTAEVLIPNNWLWLAVCWAALKLLHELSHGLVCRKHGGEVREAGLVVILLAPIAYVDVTTSWRFRSKWHRIQTAGAGIYIELLIGSIAILIWSSVESALVKQICLNVAFMATATTVLFNANPLMRFDGYYIVSDWLELPNLYSTSQAYLRYLGSRYFLGLRVSPPWLPSRYQVLVRGYSIASFAWRTTVCLSLIATVGAFFHGAGVLLAVVAVFAWFVVPLFRVLSACVRGKSWQRPNWLGSIVPRLIVASIVIALASVVPWPAGQSAPGIVEYSPSTVVRAGAPGFLVELVVDDGQVVEKGQILARLHNDQLLFDLADLELALAQAELRGRINAKRQQFTQAQSDQEIVTALTKHIREKRLQIDGLAVRAAEHGTVVGKNLSALTGTYIREGDELFALGTDAKSVRFSIAQEDFTAFEKHVGNAIQLRIPGHPVMLGRLTELEPRASVSPPHVALGANVGGPLAVKQNENGQSGRDAGAYEFLCPRFSATIELDLERGRRLYSGQAAVVNLPSQRSIATELRSALTAFFVHDQH